jgi:hypothetical protein
MSELMEKVHDIVAEAPDCVEFGGAFVHKTKTNGERQGFIIKWALKDYGWGELTFHIRGSFDEDGVFHSQGPLECDTECMDKKFVEHVLKKLLDTVQYND